MASLLRRQGPEQQRRGGRLHTPLPPARRWPPVVLSTRIRPSRRRRRLLPYGGGATLNEVDGNFTLRARRRRPLPIPLARQNPRPQLRPDPLQDRKLDSPDVVTVEAVRVQIPVMFPIDEEAVEARARPSPSATSSSLKAMAADPAGSIRKWALALNVTKRAVEMALNRLKSERLVVVKARRWTPTKDGEAMLNEDQKMKLTSCPGDNVTATYHCLALHKRDNERDSAEIGPSKTPYFLPLSRCLVTSKRRNATRLVGRAVTCPVF